MSSPRISAVLPTFNRKEKLRACLTSLEAQTLSPEEFEVIIVDDGSTDGTAASMEVYAKQTKLQLRYIPHEHAGPGASRNIGVEHSRADVIAFIEDDVVAEEHWLERGLNAIRSTDADCVEGTTLVQGSAESVRSFDAPGNFSFIPCNLFVRKEVFLRSGGYDAAFFDRATGLYFREDADFGFRLIASGCRIHIAGDVIAYHPVQYASAWDAFRHVRRFYFDPLLYTKHPRLYRGLLEVKKIGPLRLNRPFHYLSLFHILFFLLIFVSIAAGSSIGSIALLAMLMIAHTGIRFRYERSYIPKFWKIADTAMYLALPFYYLYWFLRGCRRFKQWACFF